MKISVSISLDYEVLEKVKICAELSDRSVSSYINMILKKSLSGTSISKPKKE